MFNKIEENQSNAFKLSTSKNIINLPIQPSNLIESEKEIVVEKDSESMVDEDEEHKKK